MIMIEDATITIKRYKIIFLKVLGSEYWTDVPAVRKKLFLPLLFIVSYLSRDG